MADRPTPRDGWTAVRSPSRDLIDAPTPSAVEPPHDAAQPKRDMTVDYATHRLAPADEASPAQPKRDMTVDYATHRLAPADKASPAQPKRDMTVDYATHRLAPEDEASPAPIKRDSTVGYAAQRPVAPEKASPVPTKRETTIGYAARPPAALEEREAAQAKVDATIVDDATQRSAQRDDSQPTDSKRDATSDAAQHAATGQPKPAQAKRDAAQRKGAGPAKPARARASETRAKGKAPVRPATKTLLGQPAPKLREEPRATAQDDATLPDPVETTDRARGASSRPPPAAPDATLDLSSADASAAGVRRARDVDQTEELSLSNISLAEVSGAKHRDADKTEDTSDSQSTQPKGPSAREADKTEEISLSSISLAELSPKATPSAREADKTEEISLSNISLAELSPKAEPSARGADKTEELSLANISLAELSPGAERAADATEELSLANISLAALSPAQAPAARTAPKPATRASLAQDETEQLATVAQSSERWPIAWLGLAFLLVASGAGWFVVRRAHPAGEALATKPAVVAPGAMGARQTQESAHASAAPEPERAVGEAKPRPLDVTPTPEAAATQAEATPTDEAAEATAQPTAAPSDEASSEEQGGERATDDEPELDQKRKLAAARARELVEEANDLRRRKKNGAAKARYRDALEVYPAYPRALVGLVQLAISENEGKQAVTYAKQLVRTRPGQASNLVLLGDAYKAAGKNKDARAAWQAAARRGSSSARARLKR